MKDPAFQLDQQCYPLLELAEAVRRWPHERRLAPYIDAVPAVLRAIRARQAPTAALFATEETPADDPLRLPYHFSSHVLLWHTLRHLADALADRALTRMADAVAAATREHFTVRHRQQTLFAYAIDLAGDRRIYHDANDLPTALAVDWGFCGADDPVWQATMAFAFSEDNTGWTPGRYGGLGSDHSAGAWPLGDVQELAYRHAVGDTVRERQVLQRLVATAAWDGALPEARDPNSRAIVSRHWFAWPGVALAYLYLTLPEDPSSVTSVASAARS
ncbi:MAG: glycoside hydrolase family 125 protein [Actinobacteria bacterium]|nr:glycoside hydrolase family 125 protein [Actinomycetota bacterium]